MYHGLVEHCALTAGVVEEEQEVVVDLTLHPAYQLILRDLQYKTLRALRRSGEHSFVIATDNVCVPMSRHRHESKFKLREPVSDRLQAELEAVIRQACREAGVEFVHLLAGSHRYAATKSIDYYEYSVIF